MKILLTGSSGFLGSYIVQALKNHDVVKLGRSCADIISDIAEGMITIPTVDLVIHAAGKAHVVPATETERQSFHEVNVQGTINLLESLDQTSILPRYFVFISSVSVYGLQEGEKVSEKAQLLATDPYGKSKIAAETVVKSWCEGRGVTCTILRLPLIIGAQPKGNFQSMIRAIKHGVFFHFVGKDAKRSMVLAADVADVIVHAATIGGTYNLTDGYDPSIAELAAAIADVLQKRRPLKIPYWVGTIIAKTGDLFGRNFFFTSGKLKKMTSSLTFSDQYAREHLGWSPRKVLDHLSFLKSQMN